MGKFDGVLLASDFDNTILNTELPRRTGCPIPPISQRNVEALRYFMDNGGRFAVATGRALPAFRMFAEQVPMNAPAVVCNGGALYDFKTERYLETMELPETIRPQGQDVLDRFPTAAPMPGCSLSQPCWRCQCPSSRSCLRMTTSTCWLCGTM